jgi:ABC-type transport system involved in multi-copper enzyme maturation permease subunit
MLPLLRAEWLKMSRRPLTWILLIVFLVQMALFISGLFLVIALNDGVFSITADFESFLGEAQMEQFRIQVGFPGIFGTVLGQVNGIGGFCAVILAAGIMGSEYNWGTLRVQLARLPDRRQYLLAKLGTLLLLVLTGIAIALVVGVLLGLLYGSVLGTLGNISMRDVLLLPVGILRSLYIMLPYMMFAVAMSIFGRSVMAGVVGGVFLSVLDASTGMPSLQAAIDNPQVEFFFNLLIQQNVNTLVVLNRNIYGIDPTLTMNLNPGSLPPVWQTMLVIGIYTLLFFGYAYALLMRRDVMG